jgi:hypothetical protein
MVKAKGVANTGIEVLMYVDAGERVARLHGS